MLYRIQEKPGSRLRRYSSQRDMFPPKNVGGLKRVVSYPF